MSSGESVETSDVEAMDTNELPADESEWSSTSSNLELGDDLEEDDNESDMSSHPSPPRSSDDEDHDESDDYYSEDEQYFTEAELWPEAFDKFLPIDKFSFVKALSERQCQGDDVRRKLANRFDRQVCGSRQMVQRLELHSLLQKDDKAVRYVSFNDAGNTLISSYNDRHVCLWDWSRSKQLLSFDTRDTTTQAQFLPNCGDTKLVTCGTSGRLRLCTLDQCGLNNIGALFKLPGSCHQFALQKQIPNTFLVTNEEGVIYSIDLRDSKPLGTKLAETKANCTTSTRLRFRLKSIHCNPMKNHEFIVSGTCNAVFLFDQRHITVGDPKPVVTFTPTECNFPEPYVSGAWFNYNGTEIVASYCTNSIYLFDAQSGKEVHRLSGHRTTNSPKSVNFYGPRSEYIISGSSCGHVFLWDKNSEAIFQYVKTDKQRVALVEPHPELPIIATSGSQRDVRIWAPTKDVNDVEDILESRNFTKVMRKNYRTAESFRRLATHFIRFLSSSTFFNSQNEED